MKLVNAILAVNKDPKKQSLPLCWWGKPSLGPTPKPNPARIAFSIACGEENGLVDIVYIPGKTYYRQSRLVEILKMSHVVMRQVSDRAIIANTAD